MAESIFSKLSEVNVSKKTEKKGNLTYLSWAWAWGELKKLCPNAQYTIYENENGWNYHTDGKTCWVKTGVEVNGIEYIEYLPVMDFRNNAIPADKVTSTDVNKTIQRSITKAIARHGLGLYIYAGEDLPEEAPKTFKEVAAENEEKNKNADNSITKAQIKELSDLMQEKGFKLSDCDKLKAAFNVKNLSELTQVQFDAFKAKVESHEAKKQSA